MRLIHSILSGLLMALAHLPFWALYGISDFLYLIICYVVRYRKKIITRNLKASFPDKSDKEIRVITKHFYRNFTDYIVETIKLLRISDEEIKRRMVFENVDEIDRILSQGKSIAAYFSHCFNWEWAPSVTLWSKLPNYKIDRKEGAVAFCQVYRPLKDKWIDALMLRIRSRFNPISIPKQQTLRQLLTLRRDGISSITGFMSDQKPSHGDPTEVVMLLNHPTAMITGTETLARRLDMAAIYWDMEKLSRGHYKITCRIISENLADSKPMAITDIYAQLLEATILRNPSIWLWSHNRWKKPVTL